MTPTNRSIYNLVCALSQKLGGAVYSNSVIAMYENRSEVTVMRALKQLTELGYLRKSGRRYYVTDKTP